MFPSRRIVNHDRARRAQAGSCALRTGPERARRAQDSKGARALPNRIKLRLDSAAQAA
jgi:hypothetical protein